MLFEQGLVAAVAAGKVRVDEIVVALHRHAAVVVFAVVVRVVSYIRAQLLLGHAVGLVVLVVEIEIQVAELAQFGLGVVLREVGALEHQGLDAVLLHERDNFLLYLQLIAVPAGGLVAFGQPRNLHFARHVECRHGVGRQGDDMVLLQEAEEAPPILWGERRKVRGER